jgi:4,5-dihydroxyphthalate decarboxylase
MAADSRPVLSAALGRYPGVEALRSGRIRSERVRLAFADIPTINRAFAPMVREERFDVCEMAIATFLQARAYRKPLVLLPVVMAQRFQQAALLCRTNSDVTAAHLSGRRIGVRAYSQTTGMWLRGILAEEYGLRAEEVRWTIFEDAHVGEYRDPPWCERAPPGADMLAMLRDGALDAVVVGNDVPDDPGLRPAFPDLQASVRQFRERHGFVPVNHMVVVRRELAETDPALVTELMRMFREAQLASGDTDRPFGRDALGPALELALRYAQEQHLLPCPLTPDEVWDGLPADAG